MEKRWDAKRDTKPLALRAMAAGVLTAGMVFLLAAVESAVRVLGRGLGAMIGQAVGSVLRALFSVGRSLPQPPGPETQVPSLIGRLRNASLTDASTIVAAGALTSRIATIRTAIKKAIKRLRARSTRAQHGGHSRTGS